MTTLRAFIDALAAGDEAAAARLLASHPALARETVQVGASRAEARPHFFPALGCYAYQGDTALHFAAAGWRADLVRALVAAGAEPNAANRLGATPLHYAASGQPGASRWDPAAQVRTIAALVEAGADPNARTKNGTTPLHRAIRTRCAGAVRELLARGADPTLRSKNGSTPARLAAVTSGRGGSGSAAAKAQQAEILELLGGASAQTRGH
jgi:hypothetical protein